MTDRNEFEDRLRATFEAEASALSSARTEIVPDVGARIDTEAEHEPTVAREFLPLLAAALLMVVGIGAVVALTRPGANESLVPVASGSPVPLVTATPEPGELITPTAIALATEPTPTPPLPFGGTPVPPAPTTPGPLATPTVAPPTPESTPTPGLPDADSYCHEGSPTALRNERDAVSFSFREIPTGQCGIVPIGPVRNGWLAAQMMDNTGRVLAGFVPIAGLVPAPRFQEPLFQPGLIERTWCVTDIFAPDTLNVRGGPSTDEPILGELVEDQCWIYRMEAPHPFDGWTWISANRQDAPPLTGWVSDRYLRPELVPVDSDTPLRTIRVRLEGAGPLDLPDVAAFEFMDNNRLIGNPSPDGTLRIPLDIDPIGLIGSAPMIGDRFCKFSGGIERVDSDGYYVLRVFGLCT